MILNTDPEILALFCGALWIQKFWRLKDEGFFIRFLHCNIPEAQMMRILGGETQLVGAWTPAQNTAKTSRHEAA